MLVPIEWLKDYTDVNVGTDEFCERMIMSGSNIETAEEFGNSYEKVVVGLVLEKEKHPDADKLSVCRVDAGQDEPLQIVCGAPNIEKGMKVPVALHGSRIPGPLHGQPRQEGGVRIKKGKLRGVESYGMICSCGELGFDDKVVPIACRDGIWPLPEDAAVGEDITEAMGLRNTVVDFEITPNRTDCLCMTGMAREAAATFGTEIKYPDTECEEAGNTKTEDHISVEIKDPDLCRRYTARVVTDVKIGQSPWWLQKRLMYAGMRPINNIVDITNFVMLEYGNPIHAFDIRQLEDSRIIVERAAAGEKFTTLDEVERTLTADMLLIRDGKKGVAIAGVMGGLNSEIVDDTETILIESANFDPDSIRLTSKKLGLRTEASSRFEKGIDPNLCEAAADRVCRLIEILGAGKTARGRVDVYPAPVSPWTVDVRPARVNHVLGTDLSADTMCGYFTALEMKAEKAGDIIKATPPTLRLDLIKEVDFIEEVARMYGYDKMPVTLPRDSSEASMGRGEMLRRTARDSLCAMGADEILTYSFVSPRDEDRIHLDEDSWERDHVVLMNPLGEENSVMRTLLMPAMLETLGRNYSRNIAAARLFEIGNVFMKDIADPEGLPAEQDSLSIGMYGGGCNFFTLKGMVTELFRKMGIPDIDFEPETEHGTFHPGRCARIIINGDAGRFPNGGRCEAGIMGEVHPDVAEEYGIGARCCCCEILFSAVCGMAQTGIRYTPLPRYPSTSRDIALLIDEDIAVGDIEKAIKEAAGTMLEKVALFDIYRGEQVDKGKKSAAFTLTYRDNEKTLTDKDADKVNGRVLDALKEKFDAVLREV